MKRRSMKKRNEIRTVFPRKNIIHDDIDSEESEEWDEDEESQEDADQEEEEEEEEVDDEEEEEEDEDEDEENKKETKVERKLPTRGSKKRRIPPPRAASAPQKKKVKINRQIEDESSMDEDENNEDNNEPIDKKEASVLSKSNKKESKEAKEVKETKPSKDTKAIKEKAQDKKEKPVEKNEIKKDGGSNSNKVDKKGEKEPIASKQKEEKRHTIPNKRKMEAISKDKSSDEESKEKASPNASLKEEELSDNENAIPYQTFYQDLQAAMESEQDLLHVLSTNCNTILRSTTNIPDRLFSVSILIIVSKHVNKFQHPTIIKYLLDLLRSKSYKQYFSKASRQPTTNEGSIKPTSTSVSSASSTSTSTSVKSPELPLPVLIANILLEIFKAKKAWPMECVHVYLDDSLHFRQWVDHEFCKTFVQNIRSMFQPKVEVSGGDTRDNIYVADNDRLVNPQVVRGLHEHCVHQVHERYNELKKLTGINNSSNQNQAIRNLILTLIDFISVPSLRVFAAENIENWLLSPTNKGPTKELLGKIVHALAVVDMDNNTDITTDLRAVDALLKLKFKATMFQLKVETVTSLVRANRMYLNRALRVYASRERPNNMTKDVDNIKMLQHIFRAARSTSTGSSSSTITSLAQPDENQFYRSPFVHPGAIASQEFAIVLKELALLPDVMSVLKTMIRKIVKQLTFDQVDIKSLCVGLLEFGKIEEESVSKSRTSLKDYIKIITSSVWVLLLMRAAAVKSLEIHQSTKNKSSGIGNAAILQHQHSQSSAGTRRPTGHQHTSSRPTKPLQSSVRAPTHGSANTTTTGQSASISTVSSAKITLRAKEELLLTLAYVQRESIFTCQRILQSNSAFPDHAVETFYELLVKNLLFLEFPSDIQPTEHDKSCFWALQEDLPLHEDTLESLVALYTTLPKLKNLEILQTLQSVIIRAGEGQMHRESLWKVAEHESDLHIYTKNGGILGLQVSSISFVEPLLQLSKFIYPGPSDHEFCFSGHFWIASCMLVILAAFNPNTVGRYVWDKIPTLRLLMQMVITGRYQSLVNAQDTVLLGAKEDSTKLEFSDLESGNHYLQEIEQQFEQKLRDTPDRQDSLMIYNLHGIARQPPTAILEHLKLLDQKFQLGVRLRQSREADFLMDMVLSVDAVSNKSHDSSSWWIADIVCEDLDTIQYLPYGCLCKLLIIAYNDRNRSSSTISKTEKASDSQTSLNDIVPQLITKLRECVENKNDLEKSAAVIKYFLNGLAGVDHITARSSSWILYLLTCDMYPESSENDAGSMTYMWLASLSKLPSYHIVSSSVLDTMELVLVQESSIIALESCIQAMYNFWSIKHHSPNLSDTLRVYSSFAKFVAHRKILVSAMFKPKLTSTSNSDSYEMVANMLWELFEIQIENQESINNSSSNIHDWGQIQISHNGTSYTFQIPPHTVDAIVEILCARPPTHDQPTSIDQIKNFILYPLLELDKSLHEILTDDMVVKLSIHNSFTNAEQISSAISFLSDYAIWMLLCSTKTNKHLRDQALTKVIKLMHNERSLFEQSILKYAETQIHGINVQTAVLFVFNRLQLEHTTEGENESDLQTVQNELRKFLNSTQDIEMNSDEMEVNIDLSMPSYMKQKPSTTVRVLFQDTPMLDTENISINAPCGIIVPLNADLDPTEFNESFEYISNLFVMIINDQCGKQDSLDKKKQLEDTNEEKDGWVYRNKICNALSYCDSKSGALEIANSLALLYEHIGNCKDPEHSTTCLSILQTVIDIVIKEYSLASSITFANSLINNLGFCQIKKRNIAGICNALTSIINFIHDAAVTWSSEGMETSLTLNTSTTERIATLVKQLEVLQYCKSKNEVNECALQTGGLHWLVTLPELKNLKPQDHDRMIISLINGIFSTPFYHGDIIENYHTILRQVKRLLVSQLYMKYPKLVARMLQSQYPDWMVSIVLNDSNENASTPQDQNSSNLISFIQSSLRKMSGIETTPNEYDNQVDTKPLMDDLDTIRELSIAYPLLVLDELIPLLLKLKGTVTLTKVYLGTKSLLNLFDVIYLLRHHVAQDTKRGFLHAVNISYEVLNVIMSNQALGFHSLVVKVWDIFFALSSLNPDAAMSQIWTEDNGKWQTLESIIELYNEFPETNEVSQILKLRNENINEFVTILSSGSYLSAIFIQNSLKAILKEADKNILKLQGLAIDNEPEPIDIELLQKSYEAFLQVLQSDHLTIPPAVLMTYIPSLVASYKLGNHTPSTIKLLCELSLVLMKRVIDSIPVLTQEFINLLQSSVLKNETLKNAAITFATEFLPFTSLQQGKLIVLQLVEDSRSSTLLKRNLNNVGYQEIAREKLMVYMNKTALSTRIQVYMDQMGSAPQDTSPSITRSILTPGSSPVQ